MITKPIIGAISAVGVLNMECRNRYRTGSKTGASKVIKKFLNRTPIGNQVVNIYKNSIISSTTKKI